MADAREELADFIALLNTRDALTYAQKADALIRFIAGHDTLLSEIFIVERPKLARESQGQARIDVDESQIEVIKGGEQQS